MKRLLPAILAGAALMFANAAFAAEPVADLRSIAADMPAAPAKIDAIRAIAGSWASKDGMLGFSPLTAGELVGHLQVLVNGAPGLHELWVVKAKGDSLVLLQTFFNADLAPMNESKWTERRLIAIEGGRFYFDNMTLTPKADTLDIAVRVAPTRVINFNFTRVK